MRKPGWLLVLALACGLIAAGCGGDDDDGGDALSKEEFIAQGNEVCTAGNAELQAAGETAGSGGPGTPQFDAFVTDTLVPNVQGQIDDLRALGIPEGDEDTVNGILDDAEAALADIEADPSVLAQGNPFADVNQRLSDYGLTECADG